MKKIVLQRRKVCCRSGVKLWLLGAVIVLPLLLTVEARSANEYINSAHGDSSYGVDRADSQLNGYAKGNCGHCHEAHSSIGGSEPDPIGGSPSKYILFYPNHTSQTDNFCFKCHDGTTTIAQTAVNNYSYSRRAGNYTTDTVDDVLQAFTTGGTPSIVSVHNLDDISTYITGQWGYTANSNPCAACHNPHKVQGDPENSSGRKSTTRTNVWPLFRPSQHNDGTWDYWGDDAGEKTSDYTANYQAPYSYNSSANYEPDGSATTNGANLTDINTFCLDCHASEVPSSSTTSLGGSANNGDGSPTTAGYLTAIDWTNDRHGAAGGSTTNMKGPYSNNTNYVLVCTDCHEGHGSPSVALVRREVNYSTPTGTNVVPIDVSTMLGTDTDTTDSLANKGWVDLCTNCHNAVLKGAGWPAGHMHPNYTLPESSGCSNATCHPPSSSNTYWPCGKCHYHGSTGYYYAPDGTNTWQAYGKNLF